MWLMWLNVEMPNMYSLTSNFTLKHKSLHCQWWWKFFFDFFFLPSSTDELFGIHWLSNGRQWTRNWLCNCDSRADVYWENIFPYHLWSSSTCICSDVANAARVLEWSNFRQTQTDGINLRFWETFSLWKP